MEKTEEMKDFDDERIQPTPKDKLDGYYRDILKPFTAKELEFHAKDRLLKSSLEAIHAMNFDLMFELDEWIRYCDGKGERPETNLSTLFTPARNGDNNAVKYGKRLCAQLALFEHGAVKRLPIFAFASRSTLTLIAMLKAFCPTSHIKEAETVFRSFIDEVAYVGKSEYTKDEFRKLLFGKYMKFLELCAANAPELDAEVERRLKAPKPMQVELKGKPEVKLEKPVKQKIDDIYTAAVEGKEVDDGRKMSNIRRKMVAEAADLKIRKNISARSAATLIIKKYANVKGAYSNDEATALGRAIRRECGLRT